jgi:hypothetical protein
MRPHPQGEPEVAFVNPAAENVHARPARVALETDHRLTVSAIPTMGLTAR